MCVCERERVCQEKSQEKERVSAPFSKSLRSQESQEIDKRDREFVCLRP